MDNLDAWLAPGKRENMRALCETLPEVIRDVLAGKEYTDEEIVKTPLYQKYYRRMSVNERRKRWIERFRQYKFHIESIRDVGILYPIHLVEWRGRYIIYRGFKRVVIAHELGIPTLKAEVVTPDTSLGIAYKDVVEQVRRKNDIRHQESSGAR